MAKTSTKTTEKKRRVQFEIAAGEAREVRLLGDFNGWKPGAHVMKKDGAGIWRRTVMLPPGTYEYKFLVDGHWVNDPQNNNVRHNSYGTANNLIQIA